MRTPYSRARGNDGGTCTHYIYMFNVDFVIFTMRRRDVIRSSPRIVGVHLDRGAELLRYFWQPFDSALQVKFKL